MTKEQTLEAYHIWMADVLERLHKSQMRMEHSIANREWGPALEHARQVVMLLQTAKDAHATINALKEGAEL